MNGCRGIGGAKEQASRLCKARAGGMPAYAILKGEVHSTRLTACLLPAYVSRAARGSAASGGDLKYRHISCGQKGGVMIKALRAQHA